MTDVRFSNNSDRLFQINANQTSVQTLDFSSTQLSIGTSYNFSGPRALTPINDTQYLVVVDSLTSQSIPGKVLDTTNGTTFLTFNMSAFSFFAELKKRQLVASCITNGSDLTGLKVFGVVEDDFGSTPPVGLVQSVVLIGTATPTATATPTTTPTSSATVTPSPTVSPLPSPTPDPTVVPPPLGTTPTPTGSPVVTPTPISAANDVALGKINVSQIKPKKYSVSLTLSNLGPSDVGSFFVHFNLLKSKSKLSGFLIKKVRINGLTAGKIITVSFQAQRPRKIIAGKYFIAALLDPEGSIDQLNTVKSNDSSISQGKMPY
jgi:hypothetical protein